MSDDDTAFATAMSLPVVVLLACLLLVVLYPAAAQQQQMLSFSIEDTVWRASDRHRILVSPNGDFAAGFRRLDSSPPGEYYRFAVWVVVASNNDDGASRTSASEEMVIWYATHHRSYSAVKGDRTSTLAVDTAGRLSWTAAGNRVIWSPVTNSATSGAVAAAVLLLNNSGSLVYSGGAGSWWSSFEEPTDTVMPGQAIPNNEAGSRKTTLQSANGRYRLARSATTLLLGDLEYASINPLLNLTDDGRLILGGLANSQLVATDVGDTKVLRRLRLDDDGNLRLYSMAPKSPPWKVVWNLLQDICVVRGTCAAGRVCIPVGADGSDCVCPPGYTNATRDGPCQPRARTYRDDDKFVPLDFVSFSGNATGSTVDPGPLMERVKQPKNLEECQRTCLRDRRCVAFGYRLDGFRTCLLYWGLVDGLWDPVVETTTFLRVAKSDMDSNPFDARVTKKVATACSEQPALPRPRRSKVMTMKAHIAILTAMFGAELLVAAASFWVFLRRYARYREAVRSQVGPEWLPASGGLRRFSYAELKAATEDFSHVVGRGAYGTVYRGDLPDRRAVAVKQLRGVDGGEQAEFWAEVTIIARMHHLNLVRMWGFCADQDKRMLVYEYVPNGSLDRHLFFSPPPPPTSSGGSGTGTGNAAADVAPSVLDLHTRYRIALGVARAIAYLHEECLEWVLHCDIKPENILLGDDFCPKVSDFGVSKLIREHDRVAMSRIRGTRGYMAPEWVMHGRPITAKADVYSYGMVLLEIMSGRRGCGFRHQQQKQLHHHSEEEWYFPKWAYEKAYEDLHIDEILDPRLAASCDDATSVATVDRMVKTAMWCLQDHAEMRPSMGKVAKMLDGSIEITKPGKPTIFCHQDHEVTTSNTLDTDTGESSSMSN